MRAPAVSPARPLGRLALLFVALVLATLAMTIPAKADEPSGTENVGEAAVVADFVGESSDDASDAEDRVAFAAGPESADAPTLAGYLSSGMLRVSADVALVDGYDSAIEPVVGSFTVDGLTYAIVGEGEAALVAVSPRTLAGGLVGGSDAALDGSSTGAPSGEDSGSGVPPRSEAEQVTSGATSPSPSPEGASSDDAEGDILALPESVSYDGTDYSLAAVGPRALAGCDAATLVLPASVALVDQAAFEGSPVASVEVAEGSSAYSSYDGMLFDAGLTRLLLVPEGKQGAARIPKEAEVVDPSRFSHSAGVDSIDVEAGSAAFSSRNGCLYDVTGESLVWAFADDAEIEPVGGKQIVTMDLAGRNDAQRLASASWRSDVATTNMLEDVSVWSGQVLSGVVGSLWLDVGHSTVNRATYQLSTLTVDPNGGTVAWTEHSSQSDPAPSVEGAASSTISWGYLFICGWNGGKNEHGLSVVLTRHGWTGPYYTVSSPTRKGYRFTGWTMVGGTETVQNSEDTHLTGNATLTAGWKRATTTLSFDANGGEGGQEDSVGATYGEYLPGIASSKPKREGYIFMGWYDAKGYASGTLYYDRNAGSVRAWDKEDEEATLYAGWEPGPKVVSLHHGGATSAPATSEVYVKDSDPFAGYWADYQCTVSFKGLASLPSKPGHRFAGYAGPGGNDGLPLTYIDGAGRLVDYGTWRLSDGDIWTAQWQAKTTVVSFDANGGEGGQEDSVGATYGEYLPGIASSKPKREGYIFMGWYDAKGYASGTLYYDRNAGSVRAWDKEDEEATLYAGWEPGPKVVSLDHGGATSAPATSEVYVKDSDPFAGYWADYQCTVSFKGLASLPSKPGHRFAGYAGPGGNDGLPLTYIDGAGRLVDYGTWRLSDGDIWTARWQANSYTIMLDPNGTGASVEPVEVGAAYDEDVELPEPRRYGYAFVGWDAMPDGTGTRYPAGANEAPNLTADPNGTVVLYAQWQLIIDVEVPIATAPSITFELGVPDGTVRVAGSADDPQAEAVGWVRSKMPVEVAVESIRCEAAPAAPSPTTEQAFWADHAGFADLALRPEGGGKGDSVDLRLGEEVAGEAVPAAFAIPPATSVDSLGELRLLYRLSLDRLFADLSEGGAGVDMMDLLPHSADSGFAVPTGLLRLAFTVDVDGRA